MSSQEKIEILPEFLPSPHPLLILQSDEALTSSDDELIGHWPLAPDISIQSGLTCCDTRPAASRLISSVGRSLLIRESSMRGCKINAIKEWVGQFRQGVEWGRRQPPMTEEKCLPEEATSEGRSPAAGEEGLKYEVWWSLSLCNGHTRITVHEAPVFHIGTIYGGWPRSIDLNCVTK